MKIAAAEQDDVLAQYMLGRMYETGDGVEQDKAEAEKWFVKAALQVAYSKPYEHPSYQAKRALDGYQSLPLSQIFPSETRTEEDILLGWVTPCAQRGNDEAIEYITNKAKDGSAEAQYILGDMYEFGTGVKQDKDAARGYWYKLAADQGHQEAERRLAEIQKVQKVQKES